MSYPIPDALAQEVAAAEAAVASLAGAIQPALDDAYAAGYAQYPIDHPVSTPPPTVTVKAGVYRPDNNADLSTYAQGWDLDVETFYPSHWQRVSAVPGIEAALKAGRDAIVTIDTKNHGGTTWTAFSDVVSGLLDADLTAWRSDLGSLMTKYPGRAIYVSIAHEAELGKRNPVDTASTYIPCARYFSQFMRKAGLKIVLWHASGTNKAFYGSASDFDLVTADRYKKGDHPVGETMAQTHAPFVATLKALGNGWDTLPRGITETGIVVTKFASADQITWWKGASDSVKTNGLSVLVAFQSNRDLTYVPTDASVKTAIQAAWAALH